MAAGNPVSKTARTDWQLPLSAATFLLVSLSMAKRVTPLKASGTSSKSGTRFTQLPNLDGKGYLFLRQFWMQALIVIGLVTVFNYNSWNNQYALDDDIVMRQNVFVQKGVAGIGEIMGNDAYKSFYQSMGVEQQLSGGRYRPLSIVTFAIEQSIFGETYGERFEEVRDSLFNMQKQSISDIGSQSRLIGEKNALELQIKESNLDLAPKRHIFQIFWFALSMIVLLQFLRNHVFRSNTDLAFLTTILFVIHPIHTEVIANVKSRDEIFSLMFIVLTLGEFFWYDVRRKPKHLVLGCVYWLLALLSKEYAALLIFLIPLGLMIFHKRKLSELFYLIAPVAGMMVLYMFIRGVTVGFNSGGVDERNQDPLNDPYMYANRPEKMLSKINRLDDYVWLLLFPFPLAADYSYQHFPYSDLSDPLVYLSLATMIFMLWGTWKLWTKRHPLAFAMLFFWAFFMLINNILFDIGATMGERLIYHSSLGFCMMLAWGIVWVAERLQEQQRKFIVLFVVVVLCIPALGLTWERNLEWKNDESLFIADVQKHPNSALCNGNAGARFMDRGLKYLNDPAMQDSVNYYADTAIFYLERAVKLHPKYANGWLNIGLCYYNKKNYERAALAWEKVYAIFPSNPILQSYAQMLIGMANERALKKDYAGAAMFYNYGLRAYPADSKIWADYAGSSFMAQKYDQAQTAFDQAYQRTTDQAMRDNLARGYRAAHYNDSVQKLWLSDSLNPDYNLMVTQGIIGTPDFYPQARRNLNRVLAARPDDVTAQRLLDSLTGLERELAKQIKTAEPKPVMDSTRISGQPVATQTPSQPGAGQGQVPAVEPESIYESPAWHLMLGSFLFVVLVAGVFWIQRQNSKDPLRSFAQ
jgi:tetratricopeptide (TPR) repeat protein